MKGVGKLFLGIFLLVFLSSGVLAFAQCNITTPSSCVVADDNYIVLRLSATTNAHSQLPSIGTYSYVVCCQLKVENVTGSTTCSGNNEIVGLSATTNAHLERPEGTAYTTTACFEDFKCISTTSTNCTNDNPLGILSISATTNAHAGAFATYPTKICCGGAKIKASACKIKSAVWSITNSIMGQGVRLVVTGSGQECNGVTVSFKVMEKDNGNYQDVVTNPVNVAFNGATATGMWFAEWQDDGLLGGDPEYVFNVSITKNQKIYMLSTNELTVTKNEEYCASITTCEDYNNKLECESDASLCRTAEASSLPEVNCDDDAIVCGCQWESETSTCSFGWGEIEDVGNPNIPRENGGGCNYGATLCKNATGNYCKLGSTCPTGESPASNNNGSCDWTEGCLSADCKEGEVDTCKTGLYCLEDECSTVESPIILELLGNCQIEQTIEKGCEEEPVGYKVITWTGVWTGETSGSSYERCVAGGRTTIPCAAQVQLPFFDYIELVATLVVLAIIYVALLYKKKHHHKKKK
jgi:hypothetical protein